MNKIFANDIPAGSPVHPGEILSDEIEARGLKQKDLARDMGIAPTMLSDLIHGRRNITADLALKLESSLDISAMFWMNFQSKYDLDKARKLALTV
jgi:HTH-type transcriptional regulator/antitoxin HigA